MTRSTPLTLTRIGIDTYKEAIIYLRKDSCFRQSEGLESQSRVIVALGDQSMIATINIITSDLLKPGQAGLSEYAWDLLKAVEGDKIDIKHLPPVPSLSFVRSKIYGHSLDEAQISAIITDLTNGQYSDVQIAAFLTCCAGNKLNRDEIINLTKAMVNVGNKVNWGMGDNFMVVDKHCIGGLPGNRTTPIIVSIVSAFGLCMPKTSSRSITSPAGTADTMEVLAPVELTIEQIKKVVKQEGGCIAWGEMANLSPADDILIRVERSLDLDSEGQMVASILSKKIAAGSTHVLIDIPVGKTAKVRDLKAADSLKNILEQTAQALNLTIKVLITDGSEPIGFGIGPALEAKDIVNILQNQINAPQDLRARALMLAGEILEFSPHIIKGQGLKIATEILESGQAWQKFQAICQAQGGLRTIPQAHHTHDYLSTTEGVVTEIDNRAIALIAKLAGAPRDKAAGIYLITKVGQKIKKGEILFTIHSESLGILEYVLDYLAKNANPILIKS